MIDLCDGPTESKHTFEACAPVPATCFGLWCVIKVLQIYGSALSL